MNWTKLKIARKGVSKWSAPGGYWVTRMAKTDKVLAIGIQGQAFNFEGTPEQAMACIEGVNAATGQGVLIEAGT